MHMESARVLPDPTPQGVKFLEAITDPLFISVMRGTAITQATMQQVDFDRVVLSLTGNKLPLCPCCNDAMPLPETFSVNGIQFNIDDETPIGTINFFTETKHYVASIIIPDCVH